MSTDAPVEESRPLLRVVSPNATPEEIAALVAVFASLGGEAPAPKKPVRQWNNPARLLRQPTAASWRASSLPR